MKQGSDAYIEIRIKTDISLVSEMIFSFFAGESDKLILTKRYPDDVIEVDGRYYLGFTQEETVKLYEVSGNGEVQMETQVNLANKAVIQQPKRGLTVRRTRAVEIVPGNAPQYEMPDRVIDIVTGDVVLLKGDKGDTPYIGENGNWWVGEVDTGVKAEGADYVLTAADKVEIAGLATNPTATLVTLASDGWTDDSDIEIGEKLMRVAYRTYLPHGTVFNIRGTGNELKVTYDWRTWTLPFTVTEDIPAFSPFFHGGPQARYIQPYDIMGVKVYAANDPTQTNLMSDDIEEQNWQSKLDGTNTAICIADGVKYKHVFRQHVNTVNVEAKGTVPLKAGDYILECRLRLTPWLRFFCGVRS